MGVAIPDDMDGRVLKKIFRKDSVAYEEELAYCKPIQQAECARMYTEAEGDHVKERLSQLGYLD